MGASIYRRVESRAPDGRTTVTFEPENVVHSRLLRMIGALLYHGLRRPPGWPSRSGMLPDSWLARFLLEPRRAYRDDRGWRFLLRQAVFTYLLKGVVPPANTVRYVSLIEVSFTPEERARAERVALDFMKGLP